MKPVRSFASDNNASVHADVIQAVCAANHGHSVGYGEDRYTEAARRKFAEHFGDGIAVFFVFNGTAANCLSLKSLTSLSGTNRTRFAVCRFASGTFSMYSPDFITAKLNTRS